MSQGRERFDPGRHDPYQYGGVGTQGEARSKKFLVLNSLMTRALVESIEKIKEMPPKKRNKIRLLGKKPYIENQKVRKYNRSERRILRVGVVDKKGELRVGRLYRSDVRRVKGISGFEVPIGKYGKRLAFAVTMAARAVSALLNEVEPQITPAEQGYAEALKITFQGDVKGAEIEGVQTLAGQFGLLSLARVHGFKRDPIRLFNALKAQGIFNAWAAHAQFGYTAPQFDASKNAIYPPLEINAEGKLKLTKQTKTNLRSQHRYGTRQIDGCPVSRGNTPIVLNGERQVIPDSGINLLADLFEQYLRYYYRRQSYLLGRFFMSTDKNVPRISLK